MSTNGEKKKKLIKFKPNKFKWETNIGVVIFTVVFIYLIGISVIYLTEHSISTYEVTYGSIINDSAYSGLILRSESVYSSAESGYVQFYHSEGSKISYNNIIYTVSDTSIESTTSSSYVINSSEQSEILSNIQSFNSSYDSNSFNNCYSLLEDIQYVLSSSENDEKLNELADIDTSNSSLGIYRSIDIGNLSYTIDGYESVNIDNFTSDSFDKTNYTYTKVSNGDNISSGNTLYKLVTDEEWNIVIQIADDDVASYEELTSVTLKFSTDGETTTAPITLVEKSGDTYGIITLDSGMIRYISSRFIDIEIIAEDLEGYKIPISSVVSRDFYMIPLDYITSANGSTGVLVYISNNNSTFQETETYYKDDEYIYVLAEDFTTSTLIVQEESGNTLNLKENAIEMSGVYSVNKGYAEFKIVKILTSSTEYYIVDDSISYSISNYDHIALYGDSVTENAIIN